MVLTRDGKLYAFGKNNVFFLFTKNGQLGLQHYETSYYPALISDLQNYKITQITTGERHSVVSTEDGLVFSFGYNGVSLLIYIVWTIRFGR